MLTVGEAKVLEILKNNHLITKGELIKLLEKEGLSAEPNITSLKGRGFIDSVQNLGNCYVITKEGIRAVKEQK